MNPFSLASLTIQIRDGIVLTEVDGEALLLSLSQDMYYGLDEVGILIWKRLTEGTSLLAIKEEIQAEYQVDDHTIEEDLQTFLASLSSKGVIEIR